MALVAVVDFLVLVALGVVFLRRFRFPRAALIFLFLVASGVVKPSAVSFSFGRRFFFPAFSVGSSVLRGPSATPRRGKSPGGPAAGEPAVFLISGGTRRGDPPRGKSTGGPQRENPPFPNCRGSPPGEPAAEEAAGGARRGGEPAVFSDFRGNPTREKSPSDFAPHESVVDCVEISS